QKFAEFEEGADLGQHLRIDVRHVHRVDDSALQKMRLDDLGDLDADVFLRFLGGGTEMRGEDGVRGLEQWVIGGRRLDFKNIQRCTGDGAVGQCFGQSGVVDQTAAGAVDDAAA